MADRNLDKADKAIPPHAFQHSPQRQILYVNRLNRISAPMSWFFTYWMIKARKTVLFVYWIRLQNLTKQKRVTVLGGTVKAGCATVQWVEPWEWKAMPDPNENLLASLCCFLTSFWPVINEGRQAHTTTQKCVREWRGAVVLPHQLCK